MKLLSKSRFYGIWARLAVDTRKNAARLKEMGHG